MGRKEFILLISEGTKGRSSNKTESGITDDYKDYSAWLRSPWKTTYRQVPQPIVVDAFPKKLQSRKCSADGERGHSSIAAYSSQRLQYMSG